MKVMMTVVERMKSEILAWMFKKDEGRNQSERPLRSINLPDAPVCTFS